MTTTTLTKPRGNRFAAKTYDTVMRRPEKAGMEERRRRLIAEAHGEVLEIGAGTGLNLAHYAPDLTRLVITEPEPHMARQLRRKAEALGHDVEIVEAQAEALPFEDESFDAVVSTFA